MPTHWSRPVSPQLVCFVLARLLLEPGAVAPGKPTHEQGTVSNTSASQNQVAPQTIVPSVLGKAVHVAVGLFSCKALCLLTNNFSPQVRFLAKHFEHGQCLQAAPRPVFVALARLLVRNVVVLPLIDRQSRITTIAATEIHRTYEKKRSPAIN